MKKLATALAIASLLFLSQVAEADDRYYLQGQGTEPGVSLKEQRDFRKTAIWPVCYVQESSASILNAVGQGAAEWAEAAGFEISPVCSGVDDYKHIAAAGNAFVYGTADRPGCGSGATACLSEYGQNVNIIYDAASMQPWGLRSQTSVVLHELGHAFMDAGEQYIHTGGVIKCTNKPWSVMDCGLGHANFIQPFDLMLFAKFHYPKSFNEVGIGRLLGLPYVYWCGHDARVDTAIAPFLLGAEGQEHWLGIYTENLPTAQCPGGKGPGGSFFLPGYLDVPGYCFLVRQGNALSWAKMGSQQAGCI